MASLQYLSQELRSGSFRFDPYTRFEIRDPKTRTIRAPSFRDRIVHHAILSVTGPVFESGAIAASYACRKGRGQHRALRHASVAVSAHSAFLKLDVSKYYDSIDHSRMRARLRRRFREERLLALWDRLLESYEASSGAGLPIGALTSQYLGNFFLDAFDHWAQRQSGVRAYMRYMDDMLFFGEIAELARVRRRACDELATMGLEIRHGGVLNHCDEGVPWLGFTLRPGSQSRQAVRLLPGRSKLNRLGRKRLRRRLRRIEQDYSKGRLGEAELQSRATSLLAHARWASDLAWRRRLVRCLPLGEAQEPAQPRDARGFVEPLGEELPSGDAQQEQAEASQPQSGLSGLSAPRHGGDPTPPDVAPSRALLAEASGDETDADAPVGAEIQRS